ncbi:discoidin domain-containing protein [candidate division WOR-3 bacterium]|nr:discoidin domain-containing protein [candidate division WOR-3 bacterium]
MKKTTSILIMVLSVFMIVGCGKKEPTEMSERDYGLVVKKFEKEFPSVISGHLKNISANADEYSDAQLKEAVDAIKADVIKKLKESCEHYDFSVELLDQTHKKTTGKTYTDYVNARFDELLERVKSNQPYEDLVWAKSKEIKGEVQDLTFLVKASSSSALEPGQYGTYEAENTIDGLTSTCWADGEDGKGIGEWVKLTFPKDVTVTRFGMIPGYDRYSEEIGDRFYLNLRVKKATLEFSDGSTKELIFKDNRKMQYFELDPKITKYVKITIQDVYTDKAKDKDLCISEIEIQGMP